MPSDAPLALAEPVLTRPAPPAAVAAPLRIALLSYRSTPTVGGQGVFVAEAARALARRGHHVDVISGPPYPRLDPAVRLIQLPSLDLYAQPHNGHFALRARHFRSLTDLAEYFGHLAGLFMEPFTFGRRVATYLAAHGADYDVALDNQCLNYGLLDIEAGGLPVVEIIHHPIRRDLELALAAEPRLSRRLLLRHWYSFLNMNEAVAPKLKRVLTVSTSSRDDIIACLGAQPAAIRIVPLGVDQACFHPRPENQRHPARLLTTASADVPLKGLPVLIEAFALLRPQHPDLELRVIGKLRDGPTKDRIAALGLAGHVTFVSGLTNEQVGEEYGAATICVSPSLYEGFGLPAVEAMACASPVVVTDGGSLPEVVGEAGVIVPRGDAAALAAAIDALLRDPARRARLGEAAARHAATHYTWDIFAAHCETALAEAARGC
ncbi:MAG TPA: glycosyltransferase family 4 protein [Caulobacteraceae bacterium]|jgi:glycosyltransferase involved in cell wall biosynthesis